MFKSTKDIFKAKGIPTKETYNKGDIVDYVTEVNIVDEENWIYNRAFRITITFGKQCNIIDGGSSENFVLIEMVGKLNLNCNEIQCRIKLHG